MFVLVCVYVCVFVCICLFCVAIYYILFSWIGNCREGNCKYSVLFLSWNHISWFSFKSPNKSTINFIRKKNLIHPKECHQCVSLSFSTFSNNVCHTLQVFTTNEPVFFNFIHYYKKHDFSKIDQNFFTTSLFQNWHS